MYNNTILPVQNLLKNVYSLWVKGGIKSEFFYTVSNNFPTTRFQNRVQPTFYTNFMSSFIPTSYTVFFVKIPLLITNLYPLSTPPTNTKTFEKLNKTGKEHF